MAPYDSKDMDTDKLKAGLGKSLFDPAYSLSFIINEFNDLSDFPELLTSHEIEVSVFLLQGIHHFI